MRKSSERKNTQSQNGKDGLSKFQRFEIVTMSREDIHEAPYNPRVIDPYAKAELKKRMKDKGLIEPIVLNKRTGHIVGGHQRIAVLDSLEGRKDYRIQVSVIDCSEKEEKEWNVFLNNPYVQGTYDKEKLELLFSENLDLKVENTGFTFANLDMMFLNEFELPGRELDGNVKKQNETAASLEEIAKMKQIKKAHKGKLDPNDVVEYSKLLMVQFDSTEAKKEFLSTYGISQYDDIIDSAVLKNILKGEVT